LVLVGIYVVVVVVLRGMKSMFQFLSADRDCIFALTLSSLRDPPKNGEHVDQLHSESRWGRGATRGANIPGGLSAFKEFGFVKVRRASGSVTKWPANLIMVIFIAFV
jgi:hypothetical protein